MTLQLYNDQIEALKLAIEENNHSPAPECIKRKVKEKLSNKMNNLLFERFIYYKHSIINELPS